MGVRLGKVECFMIPGLVLLFYSSDHLPAHIHVIKPGHWEMKVFFLTSNDRVLDWELVRKFKRRGPTAGDRKDVLGQVLIHRERLLEEWERKVRVK
jgi:hypothetical protein